MRKFCSGGIAALTLILGCAQPGPAPPGPDAPCLSQLPPEERAAVIRSWLGGAVPAEVGGSEDCAFYDFAWQAFLALTSGKDGSYPFTRWGSAAALFPADGPPPPFPSGPQPVAAHQLDKHMSRGHFADPTVADEVQQAASLVPLVDQRGRWVHYSVLANRTEYDLIRDLGLYASDCYDFWGGSADGAVTYQPPDPSKNPPTPGTVSLTCSEGGTSQPPVTCASGLEADPLPRLATGSVELKLAWRVLETCDLPDSPPGCQPEDASPYIVVQGSVAPYSPTVPGPQAATLGLVGMHIVAKTPAHPDWVWATFEHRANDPDCQDPTGSWTFFREGGSHENMFCTPCPVALEAWPASFAAAARQQAAQGQAVLSQDGESLVCTENPGAFNLAQPPLYNPGTGPGQCPGAPIPSQVCRQVPVPAAVAALNGWVEEVLQSTAPVLAHYQLVGVAWLEDDCGASPTCVQEGTEKLTNTTMETFEQALALGSATGCLVCHGTNQFNPNPYPPKPFASGIADRSFIFHRILARHGESCSAPEPSYTCPPCGSGQQAMLRAGG